MINQYIGFRGSDVKNILNFEKDFPGTKIIKLEQNYRCTGNILKAANAVIKHNENKYDKKLWTENEEGNLPYIFCGEDEYSEANYIIDQINKLKREEYYKLSDFAILYRMNSQSRALEDKLRIENIPYKIVGGLKFYERKEIKDAIAYLRLIANQSDNLSLERIINEPKRGVGKTSIDTVRELSMQNGISMYEIIKDADKYIPRIYDNTRDFINTIEELKNSQLPISEIIMQVLNKSGYIQALKNENSIEAETRIQNIEELVTVANEFEKESVENSLTEFLNGISLASDTDNLEDDENVVTLMTLHSAKGLEYPVIFLAGLEEGIFPGHQSMDNPEDIEEERRLFYVGITRAKQYLYLTFAKRRTIFGSTSYNPPSRFLKEIPKEILDGYEDAMNEKENEEYEDTDLEWNYGSKYKTNNYANGLENKVTTYKVNVSNIDNNTSAKFGRSAESFLASIQSRKNSNIDLTKYKVGQKIYHKKFGQGIIQKLEAEDDDIKVDIEFEKVGHKRLMAKYAGLEILS